MVDWDELSMRLDGSYLYFASGISDGNKGN